jgi:hypothetical protein
MTFPERPVQQGDRSFALMAAVAAIASLPLAAGNLVATALPTLIKQYAISPGHRPALQTVFTGFTDGIYRGMWNLLEEFLAGIGWVGFGVILRAADRWLGLVTIVLGIACLTDSAGTALNIDSVASIGLTIYLVLAPVWACWLGGRVLRRLSVDHSAVAGHPDLSAARSERPASADNDYGKGWPA